MEYFLRESTCKSENIILETLSVYECAGGEGRGCGDGGGVDGQGWREKAWRKVGGLLSAVSPRRGDPWLTLVFGVRPS